MISVRVVLLVCCALSALLCRLLCKAKVQSTEEQKPEARSQGSGVMMQRLTFRGWLLGFLGFFLVIS